MPLSEPMSPAALEALYKVVIRDTLDQSLHRRNADDLTKQRQAATAAEKRLGLVERTVQGLDEALGELRGTTAGLKAAVQQLHAAQQEQAAAADKKTIRALEKQLRQVDQRQGELENAHEEVQKAFQHTAQTMNQSYSSLPLPPPQQQQRPRQQFENRDYPHEEELADVGVDEEQLAASEEDESSSQGDISPQEQREECTVRTRSHKGRNNNRKQMQTNEATKVNSKYEAFIDHVKETNRKYAEAGEMSKHKERQFIWSFIDGVRDDKTCEWVQNILLENLPSEMVHVAGKNGKRKNARRIIALGLEVKWEAVVKSGLNHAKLPPFLK